MKRAAAFLALVAFVAPGWGQEKKTAELTPQQLWDLVPAELRNPGVSQVRKDRLNDWLKANVVGKKTVAIKSKSFFVLREANGTYTAYVDFPGESNNFMFFADSERRKVAVKNFTAKEAESMEDAKSVNITGTVASTEVGDIVAISISGITVNGRPVTTPK